MTSKAGMSGNTVSLVWCPRVLNGRTGCIPTGRDRSGLHDTKQKDTSPRGYEESAKPVDAPVDAFTSKSTRITRNH